MRIRAINPALHGERRQHRDGSLTPYVFSVGGKQREVRMTGGLLGHWAVWTKSAVELFRECRKVACSADGVSNLSYKKALK